MIHISLPNPRSGGLIAALTLILLMSPPAVLTAEGAPRYKKSTVVDFEGALVEGKSRKPYSAYLTQQKESAFGDLHEWAPDLDKSLQEAKHRVDKNL